MGIGKRAGLRQTAEGVVMVGGMLALMYGSDLVRPSTLLLLGGTTATAAVLHLEAVQRRLSGGDLNRRLAVRVSSHTIVTTASMYCAAAGALLAIGLMVLLTTYIRQSGARAWRPMAASTACP